MFFCFFAVFLFQGFGDGRRSTALAVIRWAVLNIPMLYLFNALFGMYGLVWAQVVSDVVTVVISFVVILRFLRRWET